MVYICRVKTWMAKAELQLKLASVVSDNKSFLKYFNSKRRSKEYTGPILV